MSERLRHTVGYRARFDECGPAGTLRGSSLLRFAQDCAWIHSERLGFDRQWYASRGLWWVVRCVEMDVFTPVPLGETVQVTTQVVAWRRVWARRRTDVVSEGGPPVARIHTDWVLTDARGMPTRVPRDVESVFGGLETFTPARVPLPASPDAAVELAFGVHEHDLDPMGHVNNARYVDWLDEGVAAVLAGADPGRAGSPTRDDPDPGAHATGDAPGEEHGRSVGGTAPDHGPRRYRLEYVRPVGPDASLRAVAWRDGIRVAYRLRDRAGAELLRAVVEPA